MITDPQLQYNNNVLYVKHTALSLLDRVLDSAVQ